MGDANGFILVAVAVCPVERYESTFTVPCIHCE